MTGEPLQQRKDDILEVVQKRLDNYEAVAGPIIDFYTKGISCSGTAAAPLVKSFTGSESNVIYPPVKAFVEEVLLQKSKAI